MNSEEDEFQRIEAEAKRRAAQQALPDERNFCSRCGHVCSQRQWVGLTPEEVKHLYPYGRSVWGKETFEAIEKALKAKNNG